MDIKAEMSRLSLTNVEVVNYLVALGFNINTSDFCKIINGYYNDGYPTEKSKRIIKHTCDYIVSMRTRVSTCDCDDDSPESIKMCLNCTKPKCNGSSRQFQKCVNERNRKPL